MVVEPSEDQQPLDLSIQSIERLKVMARHDIDKEERKANYHQRLLITIISIVAVSASLVFLGSVILQKDANLRDWATNLFSILAGMAAAFMWNNSSRSGN